MLNRDDVFSKVEERFAFVCLVAGVESDLSDEFRFETLDLLLAPAVVEIDVDSDYLSRFIL